MANKKCPKGTIVREGKCVFPDLWSPSEEGEYTQFLYHAIPLRNLDVIQKEGIKKSKNLHGVEAIWTCEDEYTWADWVSYAHNKSARREDVAVLQIDLDKLDKNLVVRKGTEDNEILIIGGDVTPESIKVVFKGKYKELLDEFGIEYFGDCWGDEV